MLHLAARWVHFQRGESSDGERSAWAGSLVSLAQDLVAAERGNVEMIVECSPTVDSSEGANGPVCRTIAEIRHKPSSTCRGVIPSLAP
ncbi:hypothetical protein FM21_17375 [Streptomyces mutabilis]|uniref:Uncharacterized protein n=1 Tax=Streptomyces mutabilis TaxID=67332 RepID=A0A086MUU0_9ACTN|nr:hypothetical protein FM21_17375 [Streptomyces mutabilis]